jgi:asparagine synthase (glutamine-hydrolysing)
MGYVPQGMTLYDEIKTCRNATLYHWQAGRVKEERVFQPVAAEAGFPVAELGAQIEAQFRAMGARGKADVWCSGGLDSSIVAVLCQSSGALGDLLTLSYEDALQCDASELRFAHDVSQHLGAKLRYAKLTRQRYRDAFRHCASLHPGPVVDYLVPLKYALAGASQGRALTGEGGDPLFSGPKNNFVLYVTSRQPGMPLGKVHALAHKRLYEYMPRFLKRGAELAQYAEGYLADLLERYPGDLLRKLFYVNTFEKQGGMIFPKNYYAGRCHGVEVLHPLASLEVYRAAFRLPDHRKYVYPAGKLALLDLYAGALPATVVQRRKSGTRLPLEAYLGYLLEDGAGVGLLKDASVFRADALDELTCEGPRRRSDLVLLYGLLSLGAWLAGNGAATAAVH